MSSSFRVGKLLGIEIGVHWSWVLIYFFLTWVLATTLFKDAFPDWTHGQRWAGGIVTATLFFLSVLLHELSHSLVAKRLGLPVSSITLFIFGGVSSLGREPDRPRDEFLIAVVGPGMSFVLAALLAIVWLATRHSVEPVATVSGYLAFINAVLGVFNMIPGFPLDGGRVLRSAVWSAKNNLLEATRIASTVGVAVAYGLIFAGIFMIFSVSLVSGIWFIFIGLFLKNASEVSYAQVLQRDILQDVTVASLADHSFTEIPPDITVRALVDRYILPRGQRYFPVVDDGALLGLVTLTDVRKVDRVHWDRTLISHIMTPRHELQTVSPWQKISQAMQILAEHDRNQLPVVEGDRLEGFITRQRIIELLRTRSELKEPHEVGT